MAERLHAATRTFVCAVVPVLWTRNETVACSQLSTKASPSPPVGVTVLVDLHAEGAAAAGVTVEQVLIGPRQESDIPTAATV